MTTLRSVFIVMMIVSFFGLGVCDCLARNWRTGAASLLLGIVQLIIFGKGM